MDNKEKEILKFLDGDINKYEQTINDTYSFQHMYNPISFKATVNAKVNNRHKGNPLIDVEIPEK